MSRAGAVGGASAAGRQAPSAAPRRLAGKRRRPARSGGDRGGRQAPELEDVVGGGDELPFGGAGPLSPSCPGLQSLQVAYGSVMGRVVRSNESENNTFPTILTVALSPRPRRVSSVERPLCSQPPAGVALSSRAA